MCNNEQSTERAACPNGRARQPPAEPSPANCTDQHGSAAPRSHDSPLHYFTRQCRITWIKLKQTTGTAAEAMPAPESNVNTCVLQADSSSTQTLCLGECDGSSRKVVRKRPKHTYAVLLSTAGPPRSLQPLRCRPCSQMLALHTPCTDCDAAHAHICSILHTCSSVHHYCLAGQICVEAAKIDLRVE